MKVFKLHTKKVKKDGKASWPEIGVMFSNDKGQLSGYLNNNPDVQVYLFEQKPRQNSQNTGQNAGQNIPPEKVADELADFQAPVDDGSVPF